MMTGDNKPKFIVNELLCCAFVSKNRDTSHDIAKVIGNLYCENEIIDVKVLLWSHFETELSERSHRDSRNCTSKLNNTKDIINAISLIDGNHSIDNPISVIYVAKNLRNAPSMPISTVDTSVEHRLKVLELQMSEVLSERYSVNKCDQSVSRCPTIKYVNSGPVTLRRLAAPTHHSDANGTVSARNDLDTAPVNEQTQPVS